MGAVVCCPDCGAAMTHGGTSQTLVGYYSPPGHEHDDNCRFRIYKCQNGHSMRVTAVNRCLACDWVGKKTCFCHKGEKLEFWPGEVP